MEIRQFIDLWHASGGDPDAIAAFEAEWAGEDPPWTVLFSHLGRDLAAKWDRTSDRVVLLQLVERGLAGGDEHLSTCIATGLLEALVSAADRGVITEGALDASLGDESKRYVDAWRDFTSPDQQ